jgi:hypothetical protein
MDTWFLFRNHQYCDCDMVVYGIIVSGPKSGQTTGTCTLPGKSIAAGGVDVSAVPGTNPIVYRYQRG